MLTGLNQKTGFVTFLFWSTVLIASFTLAPYSGFASPQSNNTSIQPEALQDMATSTTPSSSSSNQTEIVVAQTPEEQRKGGLHSTAASLI